MRLKSFAPSEKESSSEYRHTLRSADLPYFTMPTPELEGLTLQEAVKTVETSYLDIYKTNQTKPLTLQLTITDPDKNSHPYQTI